MAFLKVANKKTLYIIGIFNITSMVKKKERKRGASRNKDLVVIGVVIVVAVLLFSYNDVNSVIDNTLAGKVVGSESGIVGNLDSADADIIYGWALDRDDLTQSVAVWVYVDDMLVSKSKTDEYRADIATDVDGSHANSGFYLFTKYLNLPMGTHTVRAYGYSVGEGIGRSGTLSELAGSPKYLSISNSRPIGIVESITSFSRIKGWAFDVDHLGEVIRLRVVDGNGDVLKVSDHERLFRPDVADLFGLDDKNTGFDIRDLNLRSGMSIYVEALDAETSRWVKINKQPIMIEDVYT